MTLAQIHYYITIAEERSLSKAARKLYIAQPSLSNAVKELEKELGMTLLNRSGRGVTLTKDGAEFLIYAQQLYDCYESIQNHFDPSRSRRRHFGVSAQHYSFAVNAFSEVAKNYASTKYDFAIREAQIKEILKDVTDLRSEIGILHMNGRSRREISKLLTASDLRFHHLKYCDVHVFLSQSHPLAGEKRLNPSQLKPYPAFYFEQDEVLKPILIDDFLSDGEEPLIHISVRDRATMLELMQEMNGYTLCSGIVGSAFSRDHFKAIPYEGNSRGSDPRLEIGYVVRKDMALSQIGKLYILELKKSLGLYEPRTLPVGGDGI